LRDNYAVDFVAIEWITDFVLATISSGTSVDAPALIFLLRRYRATDRTDLREALETALADAVGQQTHAVGAVERAAWLTLFGEAASLSEDARVRHVASDLIEGLRRDWGRVSAVESAAVNIDACLTCHRLVDTPAFVADAIDELERIVGGAYSPGEGLRSVVGDTSAVRGRLVDHVRAASALLTGFEATGRLPYSMLAEELMQHIRRTLWDEEAGLFGAATLDRRHPFALNCEAARVLLRLAALHGQETYRQAAILAADADYGSDARRILSAERATYQPQGIASVAYGLVLDEWLASG
jgi:hypothetical protein